MYSARVNAQIQNNRHTFQSWRDHWIKDLSNKPRPTLPDDEDEEDDNEVEEKPPRNNSPKLRSPQRRQKAPQVAPVHRKPPASSSVSRPSQRRDIGERQVARKSAPSRSSPMKPTAGKHFTDKDTELLDDAYEDILNLDEDHIIDAWMTWAENVRLFCQHVKYVD